MLTEVERRPRVPAQPTLRLPAIALVLPFEPCCTEKRLLESMLATAYEKVEEKLNAAFPLALVRPALLRLKAVLGGLNYQSTRRSVAVFLSAFAEKVYYLAIPVRPRVSVDGQFTMRDLLASKVDERRHLQLSLSGEGAEVFLIGMGAPTRILVNRSPMLKQRGKALRNTPEQRRAFLRAVDANLKLLLRSFPYPVLISGESREVAAFKALSSISAARSYFLQGTGAGLPLCLKGAPALWPSIRRQLLMAGLEEALACGRAAVGITEVWNAAFERRSSLLVVEEDFCYPIAALPGAPVGPGEAPDLVDAILERVLSEGGNVEVVPSGTLADYLHIALV